MTGGPLTNHSVTLGEASRFLLRLGLVSFGGTAGQISLLHTELVERRHWLSERRFLHALNHCMLLPGPEAIQLATYLGFLMHGVPGGPERQPWRGWLACSWCRPDQGLGPERSKRRHTKGGAGIPRRKIPRPWGG